MGRIVCMHIDLPFCTLQEAPEQLTALKGGMTADTFEEELQILGTFLDKLVAESIAGEIFQAMLVRQRCHDASGEVAFKTLAEEGKVIEAATCCHVGAGEVSKVGFGSDAVTDESILLTFELLARFNNLDHQVSCPRELRWIVRVDIAGQASGSG